MRVYKVESDGTFLFDKSAENIVLHINEGRGNKYFKTKISSMKIGDSFDFTDACEFDYTISCLEVTEEYYNSLPEFEGF